MPLTMPTSPGFTNIRWGLASNTQIFESPLTKGVDRFGLTGERWMTEITFPSLHGKNDRETMADWEVFLLQLEGRNASFWASPPFRSNPRGLVAGTPTVNGSSQTGLTINLADLGTSITNALRKGDWIQLDDTNQLVIVTADVNSDANGEASVGIQPKLRGSPADNSDVTVQSTKVAMIQLIDEVSWDADKFGKFEFRLSGIEVFE